jgi:hypothetical protein
MEIAGEPRSLTKPTFFSETCFPISAHGASVVRKHAQ